MHLHSILVAAVASLATATTGEPTLSQLIASNPNLSELGALLKKNPTVDKAIAAAGMVTVFAPDNDAIKTWLSTTVGNTTATTQLGIQQILEYHVLSKVVYSSDITTTPIFATTLLKTGNEEYAAVEASLVDSRAIITSGLEEQSKVIQANLNCTSGVVHVIDKVLTVPPNVLETALIAGLDDFAGAVLKLQDVADKVETASSLTIFAPINEAFEAIGSAAARLSSQQLAKILEYHVLQGVVYSTDLKNESVATLAGEKVTITLEDGEAFVNAARIINANILIEEGVLHVIDSVLNPSNTTATPNPSATVAPVQFSGASSGNLAALTSTLPQASTHASALTETMSLGGGGAMTASARSSASKSMVMGSSATTSAASAASTASTAAATATGGAAIATAAIGAAALFGGAALFVSL